MAKSEIVRADSRGRITLSKFTEPGRYYRVTNFANGVISLEPVTVYTRVEWVKEFPDLPFPEDSDPFDA